MNSSRVEMKHEQPEEVLPSNVAMKEAPPVLESAVEEVPSTLSNSERFHLTLLVLAWACTVSCQTLVVGTSAVIVLSVGGTQEMSPFALGVFFVGMSLVSALITPWLFERWGRKNGFLVGIALGIVGSLLGLLACIISSPWLVIFANIPLGMGIGIGMYLRFAAVEVVPKSYAAMATTLVLSGGCLAAFAGPETARGTRGRFGDDTNLDYIGVFVMTTIFLILDSLLISQVSFPTPLVAQQNVTSVVHEEDSPVSKKGTMATGQTSSDGNVVSIEYGTDGSTGQENSNMTTLLSSIFMSPQFIVPMVTAALCWAIMAMPMSLTVVAMQQVDFTANQAIRTIELHFLGMFAPGFVTGAWIRKVGFAVATVATLVFLAVGAGVFNFALSEEESGGTSILPWIAGLVCLGIGWNIGFSAATIQLGQLYEKYPKSIVQAANDGAMFFLSGIGIFCSGYIYEAGGSYLDGWKTLNAVAVGLCGVMLLLLLLDQFVLVKSVRT